MSPEQRAKALVEDCRAYDTEGDLVFIACDRAEALIATAIREAEDAAREQVVSEIEDQIQELPSYGHEEAGLVYKWSDVESLLARHASPLKSQEP